MHKNTFFVERANKRHDRNLHKEGTSNCILTQAQAKIDEQRAEAVAALGGRDPKNLEEQALSLVGKDIFYKLIKEYTEKQWGRDCRSDERIE